MDKKPSLPCLELSIPPSAPAAFLLGPTMFAPPLIPMIFSFSRPSSIFLNAREGQESGGGCSRGVGKP